MNEVSFRTMDLVIRKTDGGKEYVALKAGVAFDSGMVEHCKTAGVLDFVEYVKKDKDEDY